jgi:hypothetical protein
LSRASQKQARLLSATTKPPAANTLIIFRQAPIQAKHFVLLRWRALKVSTVKITNDALSPFGDYADARVTAIKGYW